MRNLAAILSLKSKLSGKFQSFNPIDISKMSATMLGRRRTKMNQNINDSESHIWNSFFENITSGVQCFYICPDFPVDITRVFFKFPIF